MFCELYSTNHQCVLVIIWREKWECFLLGRWIRRHACLTVGFSAKIWETFSCINNREEKKTSSNKDEHEDTWWIISGVKLNVTLFDWNKNKFNWFQNLNFFQKMQKVDRRFWMYCMEIHTWPSDEGLTLKIMSLFNPTFCFAFLLLLVLFTSSNFCTSLVNIKFLLHLNKIIQVSLSKQLLTFLVAQNSVSDNTPLITNCLWSFCSSLQYTNN